MEEYHINIFYSEKDEAYIADIPDLKYCSAIGETLHQALNNKYSKIAHEGLWRLC